jgi:hypothetical protein
MWKKFLYGFSENTCAFIKTLAAGQPKNTRNRGALNGLLKAVPFNKKAKSDEKGE